MGTTTTILNLRDPQTQRTQHVRIDRQTVWGNPIALGKTCPICGDTHNREPALSGLRAILCYQQHLVRAMAARQLDPRTLYGQSLACWCVDSSGGQICHGHTLGLAAARPEEVRMATLMHGVAVGLCHVRGCEGWWAIDPELVVSRARYEDIAQMFRCSAHQDIRVTARQEHRATSRGHDWSKLACQIELPHVGGAV